MSGLWDAYPRKSVISSFGCACVVVDRVDGVLLPELRGSVLESIHVLFHVSQYYEQCILISVVFSSFSFLSLSFLGM